MVKKILGLPENVIMAREFNRNQNRNVKKTKSNTLFIFVAPIGLRIWHIHKAFVMIANLVRN